MESPTEIVDSVIPLVNNVDVTSPQATQNISAVVALAVVYVRVAVVLIAEILAIASVVEDPCVALA